MVCRSSPISAARVSFASPTRPTALTTSLLRWFGSSVAWMNVFPLGNLMPKFVSVNEQPMPMMTIGVLHEVMHRLRHRVAARTQRQRMVFREGTLAAEAGGDRRAQQFGEFAQFRPGFRPLHAGAGVDHRPLRRQDRRRGLAHVDRVGAVFADADRRVVDVADFLVPDVGRDFDDRRAAAAVADGAERAAHDVRQTSAGRCHRLGQLSRRRASRAPRCSSGRYARCGADSPAGSPASAPIRE